MASTQDRHELYVCLSNVSKLADWNQRFFEAIAFRDLGLALQIEDNTFGDAQPVPVPLSGATRGLVGG